VNATLVSIAGPLRGQTFAIDDQPLAVGRDAGNGIAIGDASVSRRHSLIRQEPDGTFRIADLDSLNGTFVNGVPVGERPLANGDRLQIGSSLFVFLLNADERQGHRRPSSPMGSTSSCEPRARCTRRAVSGRGKSV
jgi:pSer/pThr/pTyr-binding forkhead associated (FHA) protein